MKPKKLKQLELQLVQPTFDLSKWEPEADCVEFEDEEGNLFELVLDRQPN